MRVDLYRTVHKAQRFHLFALGERLSRADLTAPSQREAVVRDLTEIVRVLRDHAENERRYIHPLFAALGGVGAQMDEEHAELELVLTALLEVATEGPATAVYGSFMRFLVSYLKHIEDEERAQEEILWPRCSDVELAAVFQRFQAERSPEDARHDLQFMLPALSVPEIMAIVAGVHAAAPRGISINS